MTVPFTMQGLQGWAQGAAGTIIGAGAQAGAAWLQGQLFGSRGAGAQAMQAPPTFDRPGVQVGPYQVNPAGALPGGAPFIQRLATGSVAQSPAIVTKQKRVCPRGYVLAIDGNCYPKFMVPRRARMWKPDARPVFSRADAKAINRAHRAKNRLVDLTKKAGAHASLNRPNRRAAARPYPVRQGHPGTSIVNVD